MKIINAGQGKTNLLGESFDNKDYPRKPEQYPEPPKEFAKRIRRGSVILDLGCSYGYFGNWAKENRSAIVDGMDINKNAIKYVKDNKLYRKAFVSDFNKLWLDKSWRKLKDNSYDFIIMADVIEHLQDPTQFIEAAFLKLKNKGELIISLPNIRHLDILLGLLEGNFNYDQYGLLDNSHIRFFTLNSFLEWIDKINEKNKKYYMEPILLGKNIGTTDYLINFQKKFKKIWNLIESIKDDDLFVIQYYFVIKKVVRRPIIKKHSNGVFKNIGKSL